MKFEEVIEKIKPSKEEEINVSKVTKHLSNLIEKLRDVKVIVGGSDAKGTVIRSKPRRDIDLFVAFDYKKYSKKTKELSNILEKHLKKVKLKVEKVHGSRDYFIYKDKVNNMLFEFVPILRIKKSDQALNITDISPLHVTYVKSKLKNNKNLADEIRLAKTFCFYHNLYGAESHMRAFSGYALEILVIYYGGFVKFLRSASRWKDNLHKGKILIDPAKFYKNKDAILFHMNEAKVEGPLILIDPLQKSRNVTAAVNDEKLNLFINLCKKFSNKPSLNYFKLTELNGEKVRKKVKGKERAIIIHLDLKKGKQDIVGSRVKKLFSYLVKEMENKGFKFKLKEWTFHSHKKCGHLYFIIKNPKLEKYFEKEGPPIKFEKASINFKKKWKNAKLKNKKLYVKVRRDLVDADKIIKKLVEEKLKYDKLMILIKEVGWQD